MRNIIFITRDYENQYTIKDEYTHLWKADGESSFFSIDLNDDKILVINGPKLFKTLDIMKKIETLSHYIPRNEETGLLYHSHTLNNSHLNLSLKFLMKFGHSDEYFYNGIYIPLAENKNNKEVVVNYFNQIWDMFDPASEMECKLNVLYKCLVPVKDTKEIERLPGWKKIKNIKISNNEEEISIIDYLRINFTKDSLEYDVLLTKLRDIVLKN
ncbi:MAG: hypothetical protein EHM58_00205 [Ignavibacteriae bacterium]|nr:MAG: hypothetical protein EHM58_00205 [Ignavibacteriota bacterium]